MAISKTRFLVRGSLLAAIVLVAGLLYLNVRRGQPSHMWDEIQQARVDGNLPEAIIRLRRLLQQEPDRVEAHVLLADLTLEEAKKKNPDASFATERAALESLSNAADRAPDDLELQRRLMHAFVDYGGEDHPPAIKAAKNVARRDPKDATAKFVLARVEYDQSRYEEALTLLDSVTELEGTPSLKTLMLKAQIVSDLKDNERMNELLDEAVTIASRLSSEEIKEMTVVTQEQLARLLAQSVASAPSPESRMNRSQVAIDVLERLAAQVQDQPAVLGMVADTAASVHGAVLPLLTARTDDPAAETQHAEFRRRLETLIGQAINAKAGSSKVYLALARAAFASGQDDAGMRRITEGVTAAASMPEVNQDDVLQLHQLACIELMQSGRFRQTEPHVKALLASDKDSFKGWAYLASGLVAMVDGRKDDALEDIEQARKILGDNFLVSMSMAQNLLRLEKHKEALYFLDQLHAQLANIPAGKLPPEADYLSSSQAVHLAQARSYIALKQWDNAVVHLDAVETDAEYAPRARELRVRHDWAENQRPLAMSKLEKARADFPDDLGLVLTEVELRSIAADNRDAVDQVLKDFIDTHPESLEAHFHWAMRLLQAGRLDEGKALVEEMVKRFPNKPSALVLQSQLYLADNQPEKANELAYKISEVPGGKGPSLAIRAQIAFQTGNWDEAARLFEQMDADGRNGAALRFAKAMVEARAGNTSQAIDTLATVLGVTALRSEAIRLLEDSLNMLSKDTGAEAAKLKVDKLLERYPDDPFLLTYRWQLALQMKDFTLALATLDQLEAQRSQEKTTNTWRRGVTQIAMGRPDLALQAVEAALPEGKLGKATQADLVLVLQGAQAALALPEPRYQRALEFAVTAIRIKNDYYGAYLAQAHALRGLKQHDKAIEVVQSVIAAVPNMSQAHEQLVAEYYSADRFEDALGAARNARTRFEGAAEMRALAAPFKRLEIMMLCRLDRQDELAAMDPGDKATSYMKAVSWAGIDRNDLAIAELERILQIDPLFLEARVLAAQLCFQADRYPEAAGHAIAALGQKNDDNQAMLWQLFPLQAMAQFRMKQFESAYDVLKKFIREAPDNPLGYHTLASIYIDSNKVDEALTVLADGRLRLPEDPSLVQLQVQILALHNRVAEAEDILRAVLGNNPRPADCLVAARMFLQARQYGVAAGWVRQARANGGDPETCEWLAGDIAMTQGQAEDNRELLAEAVKHFEAVIERNPNNLVSANNLALLKGTLFGQPEGALATLDTAIGDEPRETQLTQVIDTYVRILRILERNDEALQLIDKALQNVPDQSLLLFQKGLILHHNGHADGAREALQKAVELGLPDDDRQEAQRLLDSLK